MLNAALDVVAAKGRLTMDQAFMVELWRAPIDIWRFTYMYGVSLDEAKRMVLWLISEGALLLAAPADGTDSEMEMHGSNADGQSEDHHDDDQEDYPEANMEEEE